MQDNGSSPPEYSWILTYLGPLHPPLKLLELCLKMPLDPEVYLFPQFPVRPEYPKRTPNKTIAVSHVCASCSHPMAPIRNMPPSIPCRYHDLQGSVLFPRDMSQELDARLPTPDHHILTDRPCGGFSAWILRQRSLVQLVRARMSASLEPPWLPSRAFR